MIRITTDKFSLSLTGDIRISLIEGVKCIEFGNSGYYGNFCFHSEERIHVDIPSLDKGLWYFAVEFPNSNQGSLEINPNRDYDGYSFRQKGRKSD